IGADGSIQHKWWYDEGSTSPAEQRVIDLTNNARQQNGCSTLQVDPRLVAAARAHSQDLASNPNLTAPGTVNRGHVGSDGSLGWDTRDAQGHITKGRIHNALNSSAVRAQGENVHWGSADTPEKAMDGWMNHDEASKWGHKYNIMGCDPNDPNNPYSNGAISSDHPPATAQYTLIGVGIAADANGVVYITQDFAG
ncbi:CAP domain-containing protein, partial [Streptomyces sp. NPDC056820]